MNETFERGCDLVDVTSLHRPDTSWRFADGNGHEHRWYVVASPPVAAGTRVRFSTAGYSELRTSDEHMAEFGHCTAAVIGPVDWPSGAAGPEVDVRWEPSGLRYMYDLRHLVLVEPPTSYSPSAHYDVPTLMWVKDGEEFWDGDDEPHDVGHLECRQCGEHVQPGYTADTTTQHIPGLRWYRINGEPVSKEEFDRRLAAFKSIVLGGGEVDA